MIFTKKFLLKILKIQVDVFNCEKMILSLKHILLHVKNIKFLISMFYCRNLMKFEHEMSFKVG